MSLLYCLHQTCYVHSEKHLKDEVNYEQRGCGLTPNPKFTLLREFNDEGRDTLIILYNVPEHGETFVMDIHDNDSGHSICSSALGSVLLVSLKF